ncbi:MAG: ATP-binding protein [Oscillospiraceae bacterium]
MSCSLSVAAMLHTFFVVALLIILMPLNLKGKKLWMLAGSMILVMCVVSGSLAAYFDVNFLSQYGYLLIGIPLYLTMYLFSKAKGSRFAFVVLTALIFHRMISTILMVIRVYSGGFTSLYFVMDILLFGALLYGGHHIRSDFHKIVFSYPTEFGCLSIILILLLMLVWLFTPVIDHTQVDSDILIVAALLYLMIMMIYLYIGISFRNFSKRLDAERYALSLRHQMQAAQDHINQIQTTQEKTTQYRQNLRHHLVIIGKLLDHGNLEGLQSYLSEVKKDIDAVVPKRYCQNEAANLLLASFSTQTQRLGIFFEIDAQIPQSLSINDAELCTLLASALENAVTATALLENSSKKIIRLSASMLDGKLLLLVENSYVGTVRIQNGLPQSHDQGHGFGTKNMEAIVKMHDGLSSFEALNGIFTVRIVV